MTSLKPYELIVFDWDGTLLDSHYFLWQCLDATAKALDLPVASHSELSKLIGVSLEKVIETLYPELSVSKARLFVELYRQHYFADTRPATRLFAGALKTLNSLNERGYLLAVATGKSRYGLNKDLSECAVESQFFATKTVDECRSKPDPEMLLELIAQAGSSADSTLMVGDSDVDLIMAQHAGVDAALAKYGRIEGPMPELAFCQTLSEICDLDQWLLTLEGTAS